jgi:glycosyltransferase involved in cell wall biosynthesis
MPAEPRFKLAIFHAFFTHKGGGEKLVFGVRDRFKADLFASAINFNNYRPENSDTFSKDLFDKNYKLVYLHKDCSNPALRLLKRLFFFLFSKKIKVLQNYQLVLFSGNVMFIQRRLKKIFRGKNEPKLAMYCHTPPRKLTDQFENFIDRAPRGFKTAYRLGGRFVLKQYIKDLQLIDLVITNSTNTQKRLFDYTGINSIIIYPPVDTDKFKFISQGDYYLSYARLDSEKRIPLILDAFEKMPDKKLIICSTGPLQNRVTETIKKRELTNVVYEGLVSDARLSELVGNCLAGIYIPVNEDFGMTQIEIMSAGKPVIGVKEGGLLETIIEGKTGIFVKANPAVDDIITAVNALTPEKGLAMKQNCIEQAQKFNSQLFFNKIENEFNRFLDIKE